MRMTALMSELAFFASSPTKTRRLYFVTGQMIRWNIHYKRSRYKETFSFGSFDSEMQLLFTNM